jgi:hypothetical protein
MLENEPAWYTRLIEQYVGPEGGEFASYVGRTERLVQDLVAILRSLGYAISNVQAANLDGLPRKNTLQCSPHDSWPPELAARVLTAEQVVLRRFYGDNYTKLRFNPADATRSFQ